MNNIREKLFGFSDEKYASFSSGLTPNCKPMIGVRIPELRKIAKEIAKGNFRSFLKEGEEEYFEELDLKGMVIGYCKTDIDEKLDFAKSQKEGNIKNFSPIVISLFVMVSVMGVFSRAVQLADLIRLDVTSTRSSWYEGPIYEDYFSDRDVEMVMAKRNGEVYYVVVEYSSMKHENAVQNYISYKYEFPDDYRSYFIVGVAVSVISGILIATAPRLIRKG